MPPEIEGKASQQPPSDALARLSDHYNIRTRAIVKDHDDVRVTYAVFLRRPVL